MVSETVSEFDRGYAAGVEAARDRLLETWSADPEFSPAAMLRLDQAIRGLAPRNPTASQRDQIFDEIVQFFDLNPDERERLIGHIAEFVAVALVKERETCARMVDEFDLRGGYWTPADAYGLAERIRARSRKGGS